MYQRVNLTYELFSMSSTYFFIHSDREGVLLNVWGKGGKDGDWGVTSEGGQTRESKRLCGLCCS